MSRFDNNKKTPRKVRFGQLSLSRCEYATRAFQHPPFRGLIFYELPDVAFDIFLGT